MTHYFISYARHDARTLARELHKALNALDGITAWMDDSLKFGKSWAEQIEAEIARADYVIVLLTPDVNRDPDANGGLSFVLNEIDYALSKQKTIIPVMVKQTDRPIQITHLQYIGVTDLDSAALQVERILAKLLGPSSTVSMHRQLTPVSDPPPLIKIMRKLKLNEPWAIIIAAIISGLFLILSTMLPNNNELPPTHTPPLDTTPTSAEVLSSTEAPDPTPVVTSTATETLTLEAPGSLRLNFYVTPNGWLLRPDRELGNVNLSQLRIRWHNTEVPLALHSLLWKESYNTSILDFTDLPAGICLLLVPVGTIGAEPTDCSTTYYTEYFSSTDDLIAKTQSYLISSDGGSTYPEELRCSSSQNPCQIQYDVP